MSVQELFAGAHPSEQALIESAIGTAVFDKLRGVDASLDQAYRAQGGSDPISVKSMQAVDAVFQGWSLSPVAEMLAEQAGASNFAAALQAWQIDHTEFALIELAIGRAYMQRLHGQATDLKATYTSLGGSNPKTEQALQSLGTQWAKINPDPVASRLSTV